MINHAKVKPRSLAALEVGGKVRFIVRGIVLDWPLKTILDSTVSVQVITRLGWSDTGV